MEKDNPIDLDALPGKIQQILSQVESDSNPEELEQIWKLVKKNVPFTRRGYFAAYLMREAANGKKENKKEFHKERKEFQPREKREAQNTEKKPQSHSPAAAPRTERVIPEGSKTLYVNLGKNGRIYARDLVELITKDTGITKDEIFAIKVHDRYSFITMSEENCNKAVAALQGTDVRGRTVQINISNREARKPEAKAEEAKAE